MARNSVSFPSRFLMPLKQMGRATKGCGFPRAAGALARLRQSTVLARAIAVPFSIITPALCVWETQSIPSSDPDSFCSHG